MDFNIIKITKELEHYFDRLWPINRSITGAGFRESLDILSEIIPADRLKFETGSRVLDWTVPMEWSVKDAYFIDPDGQKHAEFKKNNLHLVGYSIPFSGKLSLDEFKKHLFSLPENPDAIPYVTSYYKESWGFCLAHHELEALPQGEYEINIETELKPGWVEVGEVVIPGQSNQEIFFSANLCHPSLANNELSGPLVLSFLYRTIKAMSSRNYTYRFVLLPEGIGSVCYLSKMGEHLTRHMIAGYVLTCLGDNENFTYKISRQENSIADRAAQIVLRDYGKHRTVDFFPGGGDEKHYCSPGYDLPVGSLMRAMFGEFKEYHTSLDNKSFIRFESLAESIKLLMDIVNVIENNKKWNATVIHGQPQLGKRGLYPKISSVSYGKILEDKVYAMLWMLNYSDGKHDLITIAEKSKYNIQLLIEASKELEVANLLR